MKPYYQTDFGKLYQGHVLEVLSGMEPESIQCCVTSPPYWGLRDYGLPPVIWDDPGDCGHEWQPTSEPSGTGNGNSFRRDKKAGRKRGGHQPGFCNRCGAWRGSLGLEPTPELYIQHMTEIFREVRRVLRKDGVCFLNLGDSYYGSWGNYGGQNRGKGTQRSINSGSQAHQKSYDGLEKWRPPTAGAPRGDAYDTSGKEPVNYQDHGCLCKSLCGVCREVYQSHRFHNNNLLSAMLIASLSLPTQENKEAENGHPPTLDFSHLENHILIAIQDHGHFSTLSDEQLHTFQESMPDEFSQQLLAECWQRGNSSSCLLCGHSLADDGMGSSCKPSEPSEKDDCNQGNALHGEKPVFRNQNKDMACKCCVDPYPHSTMKYPKSQPLKPKDLCMIPARVALAFQADGWWLRSDIIWSKPNPMPESVTDRPTKSHDYIFLLSKSAKYYYDNEAIKEKTTGNTHGGGSGSPPKAKTPAGWDTGDGNHRAKKGRYKVKQNESFTTAIRGRVVLTRNKRSVWTILTAPFSGAHYATFPHKLAEPCILAGSQKGDIIFDPFAGSGVTCFTAEKYGRRWIGIDMACEIGAERIEKETKQMSLLHKS